jgi:hypothetical protein
MFSVKKKILLTNDFCNLILRFRRWCTRARFYIGIVPVMALDPMIPSAHHIKVDFGGIASCRIPLGPRTQDNRRDFDQDSCFSTLPKETMA